RRIEVETLARDGSPAAVGTEVIVPSTIASTARSRSTSAAEMVACWYFAVAPGAVTRKELAWPNVPISWLVKPAAKNDVGVSERSLKGRTAILIGSEGVGPPKFETFNHAMKPTTTTSIAASDTHAAGGQLVTFGLKSSGC